MKPLLRVVINRKALSYSHSMNSRVYSLETQNIQILLCLTATARNLWWIQKSSISSGKIPIRCFIPNLSRPNPTCIQFKLPWFTMSSGELLNFGCFNHHVQRLKSTFLHGELSILPWPWPSGNCPHSTGCPMPAPSHPRKAQRRRSRWAPHGVLGGQGDYLGSVDDASI